MFKENKQFQIYIYNNEQTNLQNPTLLGACVILLVLRCANRSHSILHGSQRHRIRQPAQTGLLGKGQDQHLKQITTPALPLLWEN